MMLAEPTTIAVIDIPLPGRDELVRFDVGDLRITRREDPAIKCAYGVCRSAAHGVSDPPSAFPEPRNPAR